MANYPTKRLRRLRYNPLLRDMVKETELSKNDFIYPLFVVPGEKVKNPVKSMPGVFQLSVDELVKECKEVESLGIPAVILFGIPEHKDEQGSEAYSPDGIIQKAVRAIKSDVKNLLVITDVCLCEYTSHGHCGLLNGEEILNDETVDLLVKESLSHVEAGADIVAPSDMMDEGLLLLEKLSMKKALLKPRLLVMPLNIHQGITDLSGMQPNQPLLLAIGAHIKWILQILSKPYARLKKILKREQTLSWLNPQAHILI